jgi:hypothetical protein
LNLEKDDLVGIGQQLGPSKSLEKNEKRIVEKLYKLKILRRKK